VTSVDTRLAAVHARLEVVGELASLINTTFDVFEIFEAAIPLLRRVLDFRRASIALLDGAGEHYSLHTLYDSARGGQVTSDERPFPLATGLPGRVIRTDTPLLVNEFGGTEGIQLAGEGRISVLVVPLHLDGRLIGTLNLGAPESTRYDEQDLQLAVLLGRQLETSLRTSRMLATIQEQATGLRRAHARLEALLEAAGSAIFMTTERRIVYVNGAMAELVGLPREVLTDAPLDQIERLLTRALRDPAALEPQRAALAPDGRTLNDDVEFVFPRRMICRRMVDAVRAADGELLGHLVVYRDVTSEADAQAARDEFASLVSHELRTPLASVKTSLSLLSRGAAGPVNEKTREFVEIALRNLDRLIALVNDMLDLSRIESGRLVMLAAPVALAAVARSAMEAVRGFADERTVRVRCATLGDGTLVTADADRLTQVIINLLSNAIKFSPPGGEVALRWWHEPPSAVLVVEDHGPGIPPDLIGVIFDKFRQLELSATRHHGGAGLGLYISKGIVEALGGAIWAESEPGVGARFFVRLPLTAARDAAMGGEAGPKPHLPRVLLVHGDPDFRRLLEAELRAVAAAVLTAATGSAGLASADEDQPDVIAVGQELEDMHGLEFLRRLQRSPVTADIPTLMVGGTGPPHQALGYGADGWVTADVGAVVREAGRVAALPRRRRVLLMEDDPSVRDVLARLLRRAGFACIEAADGEVGLALAARRAPDIALVDMQMPGLDGFAVIQEMRRRPGLAGVPAIMVAGSVARGSRRAAAAGVELVAKPIDGAALLQALERALGPSGTREQTPE